MDTFLAMFTNDIVGGFVCSLIKPGRDFLKEYREAIPKGIAALLVLMLVGAVVLKTIGWVFSAFVELFR